ncbi:hypothetical protein JYT83_01295, partial [bacterium AH-315-F18]|nr:hypothetical protein [bacterium AH-315-F18]
FVFGAVRKKLVVGLEEEYGGARRALQELDLAASLVAQRPVWNQLEHGDGEAGVIFRPSRLLCSAGTGPDGAAHLAQRRWSG